MPTSTTGRTRSWIGTTSRRSSSRGARGVELRNLSIRGNNTFSISDPTDLLDDGTDNSTYLVNDSRDNRFSPYAAIVIDPFIDGAPGGDDDNKYPRLKPEGADDYYYSNKKSSQITIVDCFIMQFAAGIVVTPSGESSNGDNIVISGCSLQNNRVQIATCTAQNKAIIVENTNTAVAQFFISTRDYGSNDPDSGFGVAPWIHACSAGITKYLFNVHTRVQPLSVVSLFVEAVLGMGFVGVTGSSADLGAHFVNCQFTFSNTVESVAGEHRAIDTHMWSYGNVRFTSCTLGTNKGGVSQPLTFFNHGNLAFEACVFTDDVVDGTWPFGFHDPGIVTFSGCSIRDANLPGIPQYIRNTYRVAELSDLYGMKLRDGTWVVDNSDGSARVVTNPLHEVAIGPQLVVPVSAGYAKFTPSSALLGVLREGDLVYCVSGWTPEHYASTPYTVLNKGVCGVIHAVDPGSSGEVHIKYWPKSLEIADPGGSYHTLAVKYLGRFHAETIGWSLNGDNELAYVEPDPTTSWEVGQRISGPGIPAGAYITALTSTTIELSVNATATAVNSRLYDADVGRVAWLNRPTTFKSTLGAIVSDFAGDFEVELTPGVSLSTTEVPRERQYVRSFVSYNGATAGGFIRNTSGDSDRTYCVYAWVSANDSNTSAGPDSQGAGYRVLAAFRKQGIALTQIGSVATVTGREDNMSWVAGMDVSGDWIRAIFNGDAGQDVQTYWRITIWEGPST